MISVIKGETKPQPTMPDSWIDAFIFANRTAPQDIFLERIVVGAQIAKSLASREVEFKGFDDLVPSPPQAVRLAHSIDETHKLFGVETQLPPQALIDIWHRVYRHIRGSVQMLGEVTNEKFSQLAKLYAAAVVGVNMPKAQESARQYRASLNTNATNVDERSISVVVTVFVVHIMGIKEYICLSSN